MSSRFAENLVRDFFKRSFILAAILTLVLALLIPSVIYFYHLHQYELESAELLDSFIQREMRFSPEEMLNNPAKRENVVNRIGIFMEFGNLVEFKIWSRDSRIVYAFQGKDQIGKHYDNRRLRETLKNGERFVEIEETRDTENAILKPYGKLVELYSPIIHQGAIVGAVEVYRVAPPYSLLRTHIVIVVLLAVLIVGLLYFLLYSQFRRAATELVVNENTLQYAYKSLGLSYFDTIRSLIKALELRDMETEGHSERVVAMSLYVATKMGIDGHERDNLVLGSYLHDIGKIGVPDSILLKPGELSREEREIIRSHVHKGLEIISSNDFLKPATEVVLFHHEKWDGSGYLAGLQGKEIPLTARIFSVVDVFDALVSTRPYRTPLTYADAVEVIVQGRGSHFDPEVVDVFKEIEEAEFAMVKSIIDSKGIHHTVNAAIENMLRTYTIPLNADAGRSRS